MMHIATASPGNGASRFIVVFQNVSAFAGEIAATPPNTGGPVCPPDTTNLSPLKVDFALTYTGDQGVEAGTAVACMFASKVVYTSFRIEQELLSPFEGVLKDELLKTLDKVVINKIFVPAGSPSIPGRCARWRMMP
jgi:hypothetical protein